MSNTRLIAALLTVALNSVQNDPAASRLVIFFTDPICLDLAIEI